ELKPKVTVEEPILAVVPEEPEEIEPEVIPEEPVEEPEEPEEPEEFEEIVLEIEPEIPDETIAPMEEEVPEVPDPPITEPAAEVYVANNIVFVVDVSASMSLDGKLDLLKASMLELLDVLRPEDKISLVAF